MQVQVVLQLLLGVLRIVQEQLLDRPHAGLQCLRVTLWEGRRVIFGGRGQACNSTCNSTLFSVTDGVIDNVDNVRLPVPSSHLLGGTQVVSVQILAPSVRPVAAVVHAVGVDNGDELKQKCAGQNKSR